ncbi:MAG: hypothetical protein A2X46_11000 [Lentisphaerae bacterium GWF2_57_35]|nr:MAG: hypothetical protein A2X46_11000 [Lentisphaerae bacterium GWF2_57_35]
MSIYKNAIDSIILGIEDFNAADPRRLISATRNLVAGVLLLIKYKLAVLSPPGTDEVLLKERVLPEADGMGGITWKGKGHKTVDVRNMEERCVALGVVVDWNLVRKIVAHRNDIEHYFPSLTQSALRTLVADSFIIIRDFLRTQLNLDPLTELGSATWTTLTSVAEVYDKEKKECLANIESIDWTFDPLQCALSEWQCPNCGSGLMDVKITGADKWDAQFKCRACAAEFGFEEAGEQAVVDFFASENHLAVKDGGEEATITCPNCSRDTYDLEEDVCLICEESVERECQRCNCPIPASELDGSGYCSWCSHMMSKDD